MLTFDDFEHHFGLESKGNAICISNAPNFVWEDFVKSISKSVYKDYLDMANFQISQVKFEMRILHWIIVKIFCRTPHN